jgi:hypothetical protein
MMDEELEVEAILGKRKFGKVTKYLVKWKGYDSSENTWEPKSHLTGAQELLDEFLKISSSSQSQELAKRRVERILGCKRNDSGELLYTVRFAGDPQILEVEGFKLEKYNRTALIDFLEELIEPE